MKKNCNLISINKSSKSNQTIDQFTNKSSTHKPLNNHKSFNIPQSNYQSNEYSFLKDKNTNYSNDFNSPPKKQIFSTINRQNNRKDFYEIKTYNTSRYYESSISPEKVNNSGYKSYLKNDNFFNGKQNKWELRQNNDFINNNEKNRINYSYYESKYSSKDNLDRDYNSFRPNRINDKNFIYRNENYNIENLSNKNVSTYRRFDSNFNLKNEIENSDINDKFRNERKKNIVNYTDKPNNRNRIILLKNNQKLNGKNYYVPSSSSINLGNYKDIYRSPIKKINIEKSFIEAKDNNKIKTDKNLHSKSVDKIIITKNVSNNSNKKEATQTNKNKIIEIKKNSNIALKKIPISPKRKKDNQPQMIINNNGNTKIKNNYSYTAIKPKDDNRNIQPGMTEKPKKSIKKIKFADHNALKKSISYEINKSFNYKNNEKDNNVYKANNNKLNTIYIGSKLLKEENTNNNNKTVNNISYLNRSDYNDNKDISFLKNNLVLSGLKEGKSGFLDSGNNVVNKSIRRLNSHQQFGINDENPNKGNSKIKLIRHNLINTTIIDHMENKKNNEDKNSSKNLSYNKIPIKKSNIDTKSNNNMNNNIQIKREKIKNKNSIHTIAIQRVKPKFLENMNPSLNTKKNNNRIIILNENNQQKQKNKRYLSDFPKHESRVSFKNSENKNKNDNNNESDEDWEDNEFMGLKKKTYDPGRRKIKNKFKNESNNLIKNTFLSPELISPPEFIKACEAITVPGKNETGNKKINQDSYIIERNINGIFNFNIFGVLDGHGEDGHYASQFVSRYIISHIKNHPLIKKCEDAKEIYQKLILNGYQIIANLFTDADIQIQKERFNVKNSGTTCVIVIQVEEKIICANAGDSRAIMIFDKSHDDNLINSKIYPLSYDCKPELPNERKRIYECGGSVEKAFDDNDEEGGPFRVWVYGEDYPGLAMSRSIGDMDAKKIGVIPDPQIVEYTIDYSTKYLLICSDGVWEFIDNEDAMTIGNKFYLRNDANGLCQELYKRSVEFWLKEDCVIDDITAIAIFF